MTRPRSLLVLSLLVLTVVGCAAPREANRAFTYDPPGSIDTRDREIAAPIRGTHAFEEYGVVFSTEFDGGRLNELRAVAPDSFRAVIRPENAPINNSAWYAFKAWSGEPRTVALHLTYEDGRHRYYPKWSRDGRNWTPLDSAAVRRIDETESAWITLDLGPDTLWISAQEMLTLGRFDEWMDGLALSDDVRRGEIGRSRAGRPLYSVEMGNADAGRWVAVIGRLHPPEVTGSLALKAFLERLAANDDLAEQFRTHFAVLAVPMMNPDGVAGGHWRHNTGGVDLNRDWENFHQQETRHARDAFLGVTETGGRIVFALDFHSTAYDIFYTIAKEHETNPPLAIDRWLARLDERLSAYDVNEDPTAIASPVSKNWFYKTFGAPAVIYEVGDDTDRALIRQVAEASAEALMETLLEAFAGEARIGE